MATYAPDTFRYEALQLAIHISSQLRHSEWLRELMAVAKATIKKHKAKKKSPT